jgi:hypothetical protein
LGFIVRIAVTNAVLSSSGDAAIYPAFELADEFVSLVERASVAE